MLIVQNVSYIHPNRELLFDNLTFTLPRHAKAALVGDNGSGKSTLLKLIAGELLPTKGQIIATESPYYIPQIFGQYDHLTIAEALHISHKLRALHEILNGQVTELNMEILNDDWTIEERCREALQNWDLPDINLYQSMKQLSGGQKTKVLLAGIEVHRPSFILLDEPSNHLDIDSRKKLYDAIADTSATLLAVSHDRNLLGLLNTVYECNKGKLSTYGGDFVFYMEQKEIENHAWQHRIQSQEKEIRKAKEKERENAERQQKMDARGKKKQEKAGVARIMMNSLRNQAEQSSSKMKAVHNEKISGLSKELTELRAQRPDSDKMKFDFDNSKLHSGKILFQGENINHVYKDTALWPKNLHFQIKSGDRISLSGKNGSGKTTLINILLGQLAPTQGQISRKTDHIVYIDQDYSLINNSISVYEQAQTFNQAAWQEHEIKIRLNRFLFDKGTWDKSCATLSGGERMRLALCCLTVWREAPEVIILDEPTNNLDIQNTDILTTAIKDYQGTLLVVSHDAYFLEQICIEREIRIESSK